MFELPRAKRIRRDELQSPASSPRSSPDPEFAELLRARVGNHYAFTGVADNGPPAEEAHGAVAEETEDEAELILFADHSSAQKSSRIRLASPRVDSTNPGFVKKRPRSYYFAEDLGRMKKSHLQSVAVNGSEVVEMSRQPWPGCALPWKVRSISSAGLKRVVRIGHPPVCLTVDEKVQKKRRKGKKTRIALRKKQQASQSQKEQQVILAKQKEEALKEKKTRMNRVKKLRKKAKEKAKMTTGDVDADTEAADDGEV